MSRFLSICASSSILPRNCGPVGQEEKCARGGNCTWKTPKTKINLHVRGGHVLPTQDPANNTMYSRLNPMGLVVALDDKQQAQGSLFWDDGEQIGPGKSNYQMITFNADKGSVNITVQTNLYTDASKFHFGRITVFGVSADGQYDVILKIDQATKGTQSARVDANRVLKITGLKLLLSKSHQISWTFKKKAIPSTALELSMALPYMFLGVFFTIWKNVL